MKLVAVCQLVELVDGYRHVASIAQTANGDIDVIKSRVANLVWVVVNFVSSTGTTTTAAAAAVVHFGWLTFSVSTVVLLNQLL